MQLFVLNPDVGVNLCRGERVREFISDSVP
jgi:hypothetical protein